jgi:hypothetical protein
VGVEINRADRINMDQARPLTNVDSAHSIGAAPGLTGEGVTVAVIDSGIDTDHPDLADDLVAEACFCGPTCCPGGVATASGPGSAEDVDGHGTHVAGIITSNGSASPLGVAPDAGIVAIRICNPATGFCMVADQLAAMNWIIDTRPDVDAVNMSIGGGSYAGDCDAFSPGVANAIDTLRAKGVPFMIAAGNNGFVNTLAAPACIKNAISVGNVHDSNYGPSPPSGSWCLDGQGCSVLCSDPTTAADKLICSTNASATLDVLAPGAAILSSGIGGGAETKTGTSMSSPFTAGCVALMLEQDPSLTPDDVERRLEGTGRLVKDSRPGGGRTYPRIDCRAALEVECFTSQSSDPVWGDPSLPIAIADLAVAESSLASPAFEGRIVDVNIKDLAVSHTWVSDLRFQLFTPDLVRNAYVIDRVCSSDDDVDLDLDDAAATSIPCPPTDGAVHLPTNALSVFNGYPATTRTAGQSMGPPDRG